MQPAFLLTETGYIVHVINPLITKKQNQIALRRVKTDAKDAHLIRYCLINGAGYPFHETAESMTLKTLVRQRVRLVRIRSGVKLRQREVEHHEDYLKKSITSVNRELADFLNSKIKTLDKILVRCNPDTQKLLQSIPGVGPQTSAALIAEVGDIARFSCPKKLTAYIGIDPRVHQSGTSINGRGYITKRGNKLLRTRIYNASGVAVMRPGMFQEYFLKKRSEGKPYRVALCAVMNKMVHVIYAVWSRGTPFAKER
jgi:transposase